MKQKKTILAVLMLMLSVSVFAQNKIIGNVIDSNGEPIIGAGVKVKGTGIGTITNVEGNFELNAETIGTLVISYLGLETQEIPINGKASFNITMKEDLIALDEVVVVGYGTQKKASLTSAISSIKGEDAFKDRGINNASVALQGTIPGLTVTRSSTRPGSEGAAMKIRGDISINGDSSPLVLIDGISGSLDELNSMDPNDIDNISVLKDASAAIYGARSASGVLLVTTKRGTKGKTKITYNGSVSRTIDGIQAALTTTEQWMDMFYEAQYQDSRARNPTLTTNAEIMANLDWWILNTGSVMGGLDVNNNNTPVYRENLWRAMRNGETITLNNAGKYIRLEPGHYYLDEMYSAATSTKHTMNVQGGDEKFGYMASLGYADNQSQLKVAKDGEKKYSGRLNMDFQASKRLKLETGMSYELRNIQTPTYNIGNAGWEDPWFWPRYNKNGDYYDAFSGNRNPIAQVVGGGDTKNDYTTFRGNAKATVDLGDLLKGLSIYGTGGYKKVERATQTNTIRIQYYDWEGNETGNRNNPGSLYEQMQRWTNITLGGFVNYDNTFAKDHHVTAMAGITSEEEAWKSIRTGRLQGPLFPGSGLVDLNVMASGTNNVAEGGQNEWAFLSYLTRLNYIYKSKYLVEFLGRRDGSSKLYPEQRWKNFFSASGGWVITGEDFMKDISLINHLKVRYNYGKTGSVEGIGNYERYATISTGSAYFGGNGLTAQPSAWLGGMTSAERTWETVNSHNAGLDFTALRNRLSGSFDWYKKTNQGMFLSVTYPQVLGASAPKSNSGKFESKGWEFSLNWRDKIQNITYNIGGWIADANSKLLEWPDNTNVPNAGKNSDRLVGMSRDAIYIYKTNGIFQTQEEANAYYEKYYWADAAHSGPKSENILPSPQATGTNRLRPGARILVDSNGDGAITREDLVYIGDASPHYTFGINLGLGWKGIDFKAFFQGVGQQYILRNGNTYAPWVAGSAMQNPRFFGQQWSDINIPSLVEGVEYAAFINKNANETIASRDANFNKFNYENKDVSVQSLNYLRLKSLVVGYTLPKAWTQKAKIDRFRIYFSGDDLWEFTSIGDGYDPEQGESSNTIYPFSRMLSLGVEIGF
ncbi:MAG: TonB-dependent receptor SusC [Candidatus Ordinivivax streblomastigis]|uniref:TonB-dependent receptor SusC n=1 Tax=Candidatus Ordinivivax streblomastigis TaxID=2540710 RepID=A0A5M8NY56_9BACT|nr:MAG: TonB-dependent receptor SusC [Candidatus Ordinivivax streblomastigis]